MSHSEETKRAAVAAYESGQASADIAAEIGVSWTTVLRWCRVRGVKIRGRGPLGGFAFRPASTHLGRLIQSHRLELKLSLQELGKRARCSREYLSRIETRGGGLRLLLAGRIAEAFGIPLQDLVDAVERDAQEKEASK